MLIMKRRRKRYDFYIVLFLLAITIGYFFYTKISSESGGVEVYQQAIEDYKASDYEKAYQLFGKVSSKSTLKAPALFRQARCATNMGKHELAIKKYKRISKMRSKTSITPLSEYNMASLMYQIHDKDTKNVFKKIIKKYPTSNYALASEYYLGLLELENPPKSEKKLKKSQEKALQHFKSYIEKSPDGRYSINAIDEIIKISPKLNNYDNLLIAKSYYLNGEYEKAMLFLNKTTFAESWADFALVEYHLGNIEKANEHTLLGLTKHAQTVKNEDAYSVIDNYIATFPMRKDGIIKLVGSGLKSTGADYVAYLNCNEVVAKENKEACYKDLYEKYPNGQFSGDALFNVFIAKYLQKKYKEAFRLGGLHLKKFPNVNSSPAVLYFMGRISNKLKNYEQANIYYKKVLSQYPDSYYAYRANCNLNKEDGILPFEDMKQKPVVFPYKKSLDNNLVVKLAYLKDYDLVEELCKNDKFIQSWIAYEKKNHTISAVLARKAFEENQNKPNFDDLRWRLAYPQHYYNTVLKVKGGNNPIILESIIKEESHFNPNAKSSVGAVGLMQLMPATLNEVITNNKISSDIPNETKNILAGSTYYSSLKKVLGNKDLYAVSAYNGGIGSVTNWFSKIEYNDMDEFVEQIPYPETKNYVKKVFRSYWVYGNVYN